MKLYFRYCMTKTGVNISQSYKPIHFYFGWLKISDKQTCDTNSLKCQVSHRTCLNIAEPPYEHTMYLLLVVTKKKYWHNFNPLDWRPLKKKISGIIYWVLKFQTYLIIITHLSIHQTNHLSFFINTKLIVSGARISPCPSMVVEIYN